MSARKHTLLKDHPAAKLWREDRLDPSGHPISIYKGTTYLKLPNGDWKLTREDPTFRTLAEGEAWFERATFAAE